MKIVQPASDEYHRLLELPDGSAEIRLEPAGIRVNMHTSIRIGGRQTQSSTHWPKCHTHGCFGEAIAQASSCLLHADQAARQQYLKETGTSGRALSLRGVLITPDLAEIVSKYINDRGEVDFPILLSASDINGNFRFNNITFNQYIDLKGATVRESMLFEDCEIKSTANFEHALCDGGPLSFLRTRFQKTFYISCLDASRCSVGLSECNFIGSISADGICADLQMDRCNIGGDISISNGKPNFIIFKSCTIGSSINLEGTECAAIRLPNLSAPNAHLLGPLTTKNDLQLTRAQFGSHVRIEATAKHADLSGAAFANGGHLLLDHASVDLNQVRSDGPLRISGSADSIEMPMILNLQDADSGSMTFAHVDMSLCRFYGASELHRITVESSVRLAKVPLGYSRRRCVADEFAWRESIGGVTAWHWARARASLLSAALQEERSEKLKSPMKNPKASQIATVYRSLRSSLESKSNQPEAADFYYGEMEMRRHSSDFGLAERSIVWLYWILSGYGLRASRAFAWLTLLIVGGACYFSRSGFASGPTDFVNGLVASLRSALPGLKTANQLSTSGEFFEIAISLLGPLFFALGVLALRGRVKR